MNLVSIVGFLAILGIAWAMSYHRKDVKVRTVIWGLGLQFIFAVIILRQDAWSYVGMVVFGGLIVVYMLRRDSEAGETDLVRIGVGAAIVAAVATAVFFLAPSMAGWGIGLVILVLILNARLRFLPDSARPIVGGLVIGLGVAWLIANGLYGQKIFQALSVRVATFLNLSDFGAQFLFGNLSKPAFNSTPPGSPWPGFGAIFAFKVLPTIVFFGGFMAVMYYLGIMQKIIIAVSRFVRWTIGTSGAETLSCSANVFVGQTEAPLLIKPFLPGMTMSELLTVMVGGFATIAGGVLAGYIAMGVPAGHLIAASVMSFPAALVIGKIIYPEKEHSETAGDVEMPPIDSGENIIEAAANGITDGLKLAVNVGRDAARVHRIDGGGRSADEHRRSIHRRSAARWGVGGVRRWRSFAGGRRVSRLLPGLVADALRHDPQPARLSDGGAVGRCHQGRQPARDQALAQRVRLLRNPGNLHSGGRPE